eukprot:TRINITY_DN11741_c1_g1_i1.p1 TRINITY_DN11741_c1_g1~~TRINITY_DN11741_c1_g1_i1.p1  ORF type:complete len:1538 (+),score=425.01 TRINITY_DN11741_c1_g1_i1:39-4616(+)
MDRRQENARELIQVLRRSYWAPNEAEQRSKARSQQLRPKGAKMKHLDSTPSLPVSKTVKKAAATVCASFKASLNELVTKLTMTQPSFVRCIAPNNKQQPNFYVAEQVQRQLRYTGVMETVRIRREGYAVRLYFDEFVARYAMIHYTFDKALPKDDKAACETILRESKCEGYAIGSSKVFLKYATQERLLQLIEHIHNMGARIARLIRVFLFRARFKRCLAKLRQEALERQAELQRQRQAEEEARRETARKAEAERIAIAKAAEEERLKELALQHARQEEERRQAQLRHAELEAKRQREHELERKRTAKKEKEDKRRAVLDEKRVIARRLAAGMIEQAMRQGVPLAAAKKTARLQRRKSKHMAKLQEDVDMADLMPAKAAEAKVRTFRSGPPSRRMSKRAITGHLVLDKLPNERVKDALHPANLIMMDDEPTFYGFELRLGKRTDLPAGAALLCRYKNIVPNLKTIVPLDPIYERNSQVEHSGFINANWIRNSRGQRAYIATQGPKPETVDHFWRMIFQYKSPLIIMATSLVEGAKIKCHRYWPQFDGVKGQEKDPNLLVTESGIRVVTEEVAKHRDYVMTTFRLEWGEEEHFVKHMQLKSWPDYGVPKSTRSVLRCLEVARDIKARHTEPIVVHCSAGVGRTGIILAVDIGIDLMLSGKRADLSIIVDQMRRDRGGMVQTFEQYEFAFKALGSYARLLGMLSLLKDADTDDMTAVTTALSELLLGNSSIGSDPVKFDASEEDRIKAVALRLLEFEDKHVPGIDALGGLEVFAPGWNLVRDKYTHPGLEPHEMLWREGQLEPWMKVLFLDTGEKRHKMTHEVCSLAYTVDGQDQDTDDGGMHLGSPDLDSHELVAKAFASGQLVLMQDPRDGDVFVLNNTMSALRVRSLDAQAHVWTPGMPSFFSKRVHHVAPGQFYRVFSVDAFRHILDAIVTKYKDKGRKLLMHAVSACQCDILLDPRSNEGGIVRLHYTAAAAEMARMYDRAAVGERRGSVVELMGEKWSELNRLASKRPLSRPPSPVYHGIPQAVEFKPIPPPTGAELAFNSMVWLEQDVEVMQGHRVAENARKSVHSLEGIVEDDDDVPTRPSNSVKRPSNSTKPKATPLAIEVDVPPAAVKTSDKQAQFAVKRRNSKEVILKTKVSEREKPKPRRGSKFDVPEPEKARIVKFKRPKRAKSIARENSIYAPHLRIDGGHCSEGFEPHAFRANICRNCGMEHIRLADLPHAETPAETPAEPQAEQNGSALNGHVMSNGTNGHVHPSVETAVAPIKAAPPTEAVVAPKPAEDRQQRRSSRHSFKRKVAPAPEPPESSPSEPQTSPPKVKELTPIQAKKPSPQPSPPPKLDRTPSSGDVSPAAPRPNRSNTKGKGVTRRPSMLRRITSRGRADSNSEDKRSRSGSKRRRSSKLGNASNTSLKSTMSANSHTETSEAEEPEEEAPFDVDNELNMAFFEQLERNRAQREKEAAERRERLMKENEEKRKQEAAELEAERAKIAQRAAEEAAEEERRLNDLVKQTENSLAGLSFNFAW